MNKCWAHFNSVITFISAETKIEPCELFTKQTKKHFEHKDLVICCSELQTYNLITMIISAPNKAIHTLKFNSDIKSVFVFIVEWFFSRLNFIKKLINQTCFVILYSIYLCGRKWKLNIITRHRATKKPSVRKSAFRVRRCQWCKILAVMCCTMVSLCGASRELRFRIMSLNIMSTWFNVSYHFFFSSETIFHIYKCAIC